jgi:hypothetical protein
MRFFAVMIVVSFLISACAINVDIAYKDTPVAYRPAASKKVPVNAVIILRDENETRTKRRFPGAGISEIYKLPSGKIMNAALKNMAPHFFKEYSFQSGEGKASGGDIVVRSIVEDFEVEPSSTGLASCTLRMKIIAKTVFYDSAGNVIWEKPAHSDWKKGGYNCFSGQAFNEALSTLSTQATFGAVEDTFRSIGRSRSITNFLAAKTMKAPAVSVSAPAIEEADLPPYRDDSYAVVIGIDYTGRADIPNLKYASTDAKKVYDVLTDRRYGGIRPENAVLLLNHEATRNRIISALRKLRTWDGYLYVYYSGHGAPVAEGDSMNDAVLVPSDSVIADPDALSETAVRLSYLEDMIQASKAKGVMVALDACFTGGGKSIVAKGGKPIVGMLMTTDLIKTTGSGKVIITSSAGNQQSWEDDSELKSGIFSHYFIKGLKGGAGKDAWVKVDELARYIRTNVPKATHRLKGQEQVPQVIGTGDFAVSRNWERSKLLDAELAKNKLRSAFEKGYITTGQLGKALDAINRKQHSKLLDAFLGGTLDGRKFGELY